MRSERSITNNKSVVADKRAAILRAAIEVFARNGYFNAKVADIARAAGVADGTVYLYFKSKEEILHSIFDQTMSEAVKAGRERVANLTNPREKLRAIARTHLELLGRDRDLAVVVQVELRGSTKFMEEFSAAGVSDYLQDIRAVIEEGQTAGVFRCELNPTIAAKIFYGALDEMATNWILSPRRYDLVPQADQVLDIFFHGVNSK